MILWTCVGGLIVQLLSYLLLRQAVHGFREGELGNDKSERETMAVTLPNLPQLTDAQGARVMAAYAPGGTQTEARTAYLIWLRASIIKFVQDAEAAVMREENRVAIEQRKVEIETALPDAIT